jgi:hypothetical protein
MINSELFRGSSLPEASSVSVRFVRNKIKDEDSFGGSVTD